MIDIVSTRRPMTDILADISREQSENKDVIDAFHRVFYRSNFTHAFTWFEGRALLKNPLDLWVYGEIIWDLKPTLIIETGTAYGASALYYARQLDKIGVGQVVTIDLEPATNLPAHDRINYVRGSSTDPEVIDAVHKVAATHPRVMVTLDSDHSKGHVLAELAAYADLVTPGQFLVVEDTNIDGRPVDFYWHGGPGPGPAVDEWLPGNPQFARSVLAERYMMTAHTWVRRES